MSGMDVSRPVRRHATPGDEAILKTTSRSGTDVFPPPVRDLTVKNSTVDRNARSLDGCSLATGIREELASKRMGDFRALVVES
jgi:hypothetical protein